MLGYVLRIVKLQIQNRQELRTVSKIRVFSQVLLFAISADTCCFFFFFFSESPFDLSSTSLQK